ncbi:hypothetical protein ACT4UL_26005, partial [Bacillus sp. HC-TM]
IAAELTAQDLKVLAIKSKMSSGYQLTPQIIKKDVTDEEYARISENLGDFPGVDAHNTTSRGFHLAESYELIEKEFGMNVMSDLKENPYLLISGKAIYKEDPEQIRRKKLFGIF